MIGPGLAIGDVDCLEEETVKMLKSSSQSSSVVGNPTRVNSSCLGWLVSHNILFALLLQQFMEGDLLPGVFLVDLITLCMAFPFRAAASLYHAVILLVRTLSV